MKQAESAVPRPDDVYFFATCVVDQFFPGAGMDAITLLEREGIRVHFPEEQTCCGQPALFGVTGHPQEAAELAARAALRLRDVAGAGARMLILRSNARVYDAGFAETAPEERTRALALLHGLHGGEVACEGDVAADLDWVFRMGQEALPRVHGLRSRSEREAETLRRDAPFVGRRDTLKLVGEALASVVGGHGSALLFIGAAGVGKSRVLAEVRSLTQGEGRSFVNARCHGALRSKSFSVLAELLVDLAGIEEDDTTEQRAEKVERMRVLGFSPREIVLVSELVGLGAANMPATGARPGRPRAKVGLGCWWLTGICASPIICNILAPS